LKPPPLPSDVAASSTDAPEVRAAIDAGHLGLIPWALTHLPLHFRGEPADFHWEISDLAEEHDRLVIAAPRGHAKTTVLALAFVLFRAAVHREPYTLLVSDTAAQAEQRTSDLYAELLENDQLVATYPHLALPDRRDYQERRVKRTTRDFITLGGIRFTAAGAGQSLRGIKDRHQRPTLIIVDDLENDESVRTAEQRDKLKNWFLRTLSNLPGPEGARIIFIGSIIHREALLPWLLHKDRASVWQQRKYQAVTPSGEPLWPTVWPLERLEAKRTEIGNHAYASEFLNDPLPEGSKIFQGQPSWYEALPSGPYREAVGIDFAYTTRASADYSVALEGRVIDNEIYLTRMYRGQVEAPEFAETLKAWGTTHLLARIGGTEKGIIQFIRRDHGVKIDTIPASTDKLAFARPASAYWNAGRIHLPKDAPWTTAFLQEINAFTGIGDTHDDIVDALGALHHALVITPRANLEQLRQRSGL